MARCDLFDRAWATGQVLQADEDVEERRHVERLGAEIAGDGGDEDGQLQRELTSELEADHRGGHGACRGCGERGCADDSKVARIGKLREAGSRPAQ